MPAPKRRASDSSVKWWPDAPRILPAVVSAWWDEWQKREDFHKPMSIADRRYRGSWAGSRCLRRLWYDVVGEPETDPRTLEDHWRMATGTIVHLLLDDNVVQALAGTWDRIEVERPVDLRLVGIDGASTGDLFIFNDSEKKAVANELKSAGGYKFKKSAIDFDGGPSGPNYGDVVQGVLAAEALQAELGSEWEVECRILYLSLENISKGIVEKKGLKPWQAFSAEWVISQEMRTEILEREVKRANHVLAEPFVPARIIDDPEQVRQVMKVTDPMTGALIGGTSDNPVFDKTWRCGYCPFRKRCIADG